MTGIIGRPWSRSGIMVGNAADARSQMGLAIGTDVMAYAANNATSSSTNTLTNKTFDANGTGNSLSNVDLTADVTGALPFGSGGTAQTSWAQGDILYASAADTLAKLLKGTDNHVLTMNGNVPNWEETQSGGGGITTASQWRITSHLTGGAAPITANWAECDAPAGFGVLGSSMTVDINGVFTFPSTGYWLIIAQGYFKLDEDDSAFNSMQIQTQDAGGSFILASNQWCQLVDDSVAHAGTTCSYIFDVSDVSNDKVRFEIQVENSSVISSGTATIQYTGVTFIRLGDT